MLRSMEILYRLTKTVGPVDEVDVAEQVNGPSPILPKETQFRIFRPKHEWSVHPNAEELEFYTIQVAGKHYNILANLLEPAMEQIDPPRNAERR